jgi:hypothetical protein
MTQALYAHMNKKNSEKKRKVHPETKSSMYMVFYFLGIGLIKKTPFFSLSISHLLK